MVPLDLLMAKAAAHSHKPVDGEATSQETERREAQPDYV